MVIPLERLKHGENKNKWILTQMGFMNIMCQSKKPNAAKWLAWFLKKTAQ